MAKDTNDSGRSPVMGNKEKEILITGVTGKVKWFNVKRGYGFVCRHDIQEDIFIHQTAILKSNPKHSRRSVGENEEIQFDVVKGEKGNEAANVCGADGNHVKGSEYALRYQRGGRIYRGGRGRGGEMGRQRVYSEEFENDAQDYFRGRPPRGGGRNFRGGRSFRGGERGRMYPNGGRPYMVDYRRPPPFPNYDIPVPPQFYYNYDFHRGQVRGREGMFNRGGRIFRGGPPRGGMGMNFNPYDYNNGYERRPPMRGPGGRKGYRSFRERGFRGRGGPRDHFQANVKEEVHYEDNIA